MKGQGVCGCVTDPFAAVPPELQPPPKKKASLRKVNCPVCGKEYWTNRETDLCMDCQTDIGRDPPLQGAHNGREGPAAVS